MADNPKDNPDAAPPPKIQLGLVGVPQTGVNPSAKGGAGLALDKLGLDDPLLKKIAAAINQVQKALAEALTTAKRVEVEFGVEIEGKGDVILVSAKAGAAPTIGAVWEKESPTATSASQ